MNEEQHSPGFQEIKKMLEEYRDRQKGNPNFILDYLVFKKVGEIYIQRAKPTVTAIADTLDFLEKEQKTLLNIYNEWIELSKIINPKLLDVNTPEMKQFDDKVHIAMKKLKILTGGVNTNNDIQ